LVIGGPPFKINFSLPKIRHNYDKSFREGKIVEFFRGAFHQQQAEEENKKGGT
jgi:hypothetical protein